MNQRMILHGDHKPYNVVLELDQNRVRHASIIDFDLIGDWKEEGNHYDIHRRYTEGYRAPSIESKAIKKRETRTKSNGNVITEDVKYYFFSSDFREDTYAIVKSFLKLVTKNNNQINTRDPRIMNINKIINNHILKSPFKLSNVPTTTEWAQLIIDLIDPMQDSNLIMEKFFPPMRDIFTQRPTSGLQNVRPKSQISQVPVSNQKRPISSNAMNKKSDLKAPTGNIPASNLGQRRSSHQGKNQGIPVYNPSGGNMKRQNLEGLAIIPKSQINKSEKPQINQSAAGMNMPTGQNNFLQNLNTKNEYINLRAKKADNLEQFKAVRANQEIVPADLMNLPVEDLLNNQAMMGQRKVSNKMGGEVVTKIVMADRKPTRYQGVIKRQVTRASYKDQAPSKYDNKNHVSNMKFRLI